jgi:hypothetical protein
MELFTKSSITCEASWSIWMLLSRILHVKSRIRSICRSECMLHLSIKPVFARTSRIMMIFKLLRLHVYHVMQITVSIVRALAFSMLINRAYLVHDVM